MPECVVTVLTVEGEIYFNSCCVCNSKVDLVPGTNRLVILIQFYLEIKCKIIII